MNEIMEMKELNHNSTAEEQHVHNLGQQQGCQGTKKLK